MRSIARDLERNIGTSRVVLLARRKDDGLASSTSFRDDAAVAGPRDSKQLIFFILRAVIEERGLGVGAEELFLSFSFPLFLSPSALFFYTFPADSNKGWIVCLEGVGTDGLYPPTRFFIR